MAEILTPDRQAELEDCARKPWEHDGSSWPDFLREALASDALREKLVRLLREALVDIANDDLDRVSPGVKARVRIVLRETGPIEKSHEEKAPVAISGDLLKRIEERLSLASAPITKENADLIRECAERIRALEAPGLTFVCNKCNLTVSKDDLHPAAKDRP